MSTARRALAIAFVTASLVPIDARGEECPEGIDLLLPGGFIADPANTKIWVGDAHAAEDIRLWNRDDEEVPTTQSTIERTDGMGKVQVIIPRTNLSDAEGYRVVTGPSNTLLTYFGVERDPDGTAPQPPVITDVESSPTCAWVYTETTDDNAVIVLARVNDEGSFVPYAPSGEVTYIGRGGAAIGDCGCGSAAGGVEPGETFEISFAAYDIAGNFSGWSSPEQVTLDYEQGPAPMGDGCGCATNSDVGFASLLPLFACWRRRRPHSSGKLGPSDV